MVKYNKIAVLFKEKNKYVFDWVINKSDELDISLTKVVLLCIKQAINAEENKDGEKINL